MGIELLAQGVMDQCTGCRRLPPSVQRAGRQPWTRPSGRNVGFQARLHWLQEVATKRAEGRKAAMDEAFRAESSDEDEFGETAPMLQRENSAALNAKLSFELPGQSGLQVSIPC